MDLPLNLRRVLRDNPPDHEPHLPHVPGHEVAMPCDCWLDGFAEGHELGHAAGRREVESRIPWHIIAYLAVVTLALVVAFGK